MEAVSPGLSLCTGFWEQLPSGIWFLIRHSSPVLSRGHRWEGAEAESHSLSAAQRHVADSLFLPAGRQVGGKEKGEKRERPRP